MKTYAQLRQQEVLADVREHRATMRSAAMSFRQLIAPDEPRWHGTFSERINNAADDLVRACAYRRMSAQAARRLKGGAS